MSNSVSDFDVLKKLRVIGKPRKGPINTYLASSFGERLTLMAQIKELPALLIVGIVFVTVMGSLKVSLLIPWLIFFLMKLRFSMSLLRWT